MLAAIWAQDSQGLIGKEQKLPWHLPDDLAFFKHTTKNNAIVMGRETFEGMDKRALPERLTIVLTSQVDYEVADGILVMHSVQEVIAFSQQFDGITFITGGARVYEQFLPYCSILYRTVIHASFAGDTYFPQFDSAEWHLISASEGIVDERNTYQHTFETYQKK